MNRTLFALAALVAAVPVAPANADVRSFSGSLFNNNPPAVVSASCASGTLLLAFDPSNSAQNNQSDFGSFGNTQSHCIGGFPFASWTGGSFLWTFAQGDTLFGSTTGNLSPVSPGLFSFTSTYVATGGTGRFLNASGILTAIGTIDMRVLPTTATAALSGKLDLPAVPEPASWLLLVTGFGMLGATLRSGTGRFALQRQRAGG